ncbi:Zinc-binding dehydrogenase [Jannaschia faecimaris]|uniref:Zinc-binding dehydrogenase n=1 Tax=Jannaschia faecimaris TaxID=1244108 RepID=A0A1H3UDF0_9RHOB|nr:zinc-binding dehydrogenase [Jannaschia faecimaris]SDZ60464.1 Zinc-binding dehydrogenase [Jannaschia faecimaris]
MFNTPDMALQHELLTYVAGEIDAGRICTTLDTVMSPINAQKMREAHRLIETGTAKGKVVIEGF